MSIIRHFTNTLLDLIMFFPVLTFNVFLFSCYFSHKIFSHTTTRSTQSRCLKYAPVSGGRLQTSIPINSCHLNMDQSTKALTAVITATGPNCKPQQKAPRTAEGLLSCASFITRRGSDIMCFEEHMLLLADVLQTAIMERGGPSGYS